MTKEIINSWTKKDFKIDWFSGTGPGGQNRNKSSNCCRITHIESGLTEVGQNYKERRLNFKDAFERLGKKLLEFYHSKDQKERAPVTETIRTYNIPDNRVKDHASGLEQSWYDLDFDKMIVSRKKSLE